MENELMTFDSLSDRLMQDVEQLDLAKNQSEQSFGELFGRVFNDISLLDEKVKASTELAASAKGRADSAYNKSAGLFHKREAIESLQGAVRDIGEATEANAESQKLMFDYMQVLSNVSKKLLGLGCASIAMNRATVRELMLQLNGESKEKLTELAKQELLNVVRELKQQQDILAKQEALQKNVRTNREGIQSLSNENKAQNEKLLRVESRLSEKDELDEAQSRQIQDVTDIAKKNQARLSEKDEIDAEQTKRLEEIGAILENKNSVDQKQEEEIAKNAKAIEILFEYTKQKDELDSAQSKEIEALKTGKAKYAFAFSIASLVISIAALALSIAKWFL